MVCPFQSGVRNSGDDHLDNREYVSIQKAKVT
jgi:hypothetical protein